MTIDDVAVEEQIQGGDLALLVLRSHLVSERINRLRGVVSGAHNCARARGGLSGEVIGRGQVFKADFRLHDIRPERVLPLALSSSSFRERSA